MWNKLSIYLYKIQQQIIISCCLCSGVSTKTDILSRGLVVLDCKSRYWLFCYKSIEGIGNNTKVQWTNTDGIQSWLQEGIGCFIKFTCVVKFGHMLQKLVFLHQVKRVIVTRFSGSALLSFKRLWLLITVHFKLFAR